MITQDMYKYSHTVGIYSLVGRGFNNPVDMAFGRNGVMYVLNRAGPETNVRLPYKRVTMCTVSEEYIGEFSSGGVEDGQMMWPSSIAIDRDGNVYISDEALQRISIFDSRGQYLGKWGVKGKRESEFNRPSGIAFDSDDNLLVVDSLNCRVQRFTKDGRFLSGWGRAGSGDGEFNIPWGVHIDVAGNVYVADWRNNRIQKFDAEGNHLASMGVSGEGDGEFHRPAGVTTDGEGNIYVADWGNERVQVLRRTAASSPSSGASLAYPSGAKITSPPTRRSSRRGRSPTWSLRSICLPMITLGRSRRVSKNCSGGRLPSR